MDSSVELVLFDMDGTLLDGRSIVEIAKRFDFSEDLYRIFDMKNSFTPIERSYEIAKFLKGIRKEDVLEVVDGIDFFSEVEEVIETLKRKDILCAIVTDSYQFVAESVRSRLDLKMAFANNILIHDGIISGNFVPNNLERKPGTDGKVYSICKEDVLRRLCTRFGLKPCNVIAVGDGFVDAGMLQVAGVGIAVNAPVEVQKAADVVGKDLRSVLDYV